MRCAPKIRVMSYFLALAVAHLLPINILNGDSPAGVGVPIELLAENMPPPVNLSYSQGPTPFPVSIRTVISRFDTCVYSGGDPVLTPMRTPRATVPPPPGRDRFSDHSAFVKHSKMAPLKIDISGVSPNIVISTVRLPMERSPATIRACCCGVTTRSANRASNWRRASRSRSAVSCARAASRCASAIRASAVLTWATASSERAIEDATWASADLTRASESEILLSNPLAVAVASAAPFLASSICASLAFRSSASCLSLASPNWSCTCDSSFDLATTTRVAMTTKIAAMAANASPQSIAVFHQSTDWPRSLTRKLRDWISHTLSPSELVALSVIAILPIVLVGFACQQTIWYRKKYCNTKRH